MADRLERMLENQKKREAAMQQKAAQEQAAKEATRKVLNPLLAAQCVFLPNSSPLLIECPSPQEALARAPAPAVSAAAAAADIVAPLENNRRLRSTPPPNYINTNNYLFPMKILILIPFTLSYFSCFCALAEQSPSWLRCLPRSGASPR